MKNSKDLKPFFKGNLPFIVDAMSCRYHKLPSEILDLPLQEFNLNVAIFLKAIEKERQQQEEQMKNYKKYGTPTIKGDNMSFGNFGLQRKKKAKKVKK